MNQTEKQLLPCPFCGGDARRTPIHEIACSNFECKLHCVYFRFENAWNRRTQPAAAGDVVARSINSLMREQPNENEAFYNMGLLDARQKAVEALSSNGVTEEDAAEIIYKVMQKAVASIPGHNFIAPDWARGGNSIMQDEARRAYRNITAQPPAAIGEIQ